MEVAEQFGRNLADLRRWTGLTQAQLGERASMRQSEISRVERGVNCPRLDKIVKLATALGVQTTDLLHGIG